jgi:hypothetical protein
MTAVLGVLAAAAVLAAPAPPPLPRQGLVVSERGGVTFVDFNGRRLGHVDRLRFAGQDTNISSGLPRFVDQRGLFWRLDVQGRRFLPAAGGTALVGEASLAFLPRTRTWTVERAGHVILRMRVGREFPFLSEDRDVVSTGRRALDLRSGRFVDVPGGCVVASRRVANWILLCGRIASGTLLPTSIEKRVSGGRRLLLGSPVRRGSNGHVHGHWVYVKVSPRSHRVLAQWSGECEIPQAFLVAGRKAHPLGASTAANAPESVALGWLADGSTVVHFPAGACGSSMVPSGTYVIARSGKTRLVYSTTRLASVAMWGG